MIFDTLVANPGRLTILTALAVEPQQEFVLLRKRTKLTDGNLASHARRLASAGMLEIDKQLRDGKPVTTIKLTSVGRSALEGHIRRLMAAMSFKRIALADETMPSPQPSPGVPGEGERGRGNPAPTVAQAKVVRATVDDWVD